MPLNQADYRELLEEKCPPDLKPGIMAEFNGWYADYLAKAAEFGPEYIPSVQEIDEDGVWLKPIPAAPAPKWK